MPRTKPAAPPPADLRPIALQQQRIRTALSTARAALAQEQETAQELATLRQEYWELRATHIDAYLSVASAATTARTRVAAAHAQVQALEQELADWQFWEDRRAQILAALLEQYQGRGTHYDLLCAGLARAQVALEQQDQRGPAARIQDYRLYAHEVREITAQLQRYTEAQRTEHLAVHRQEGVLLAVRALEAIIQPAQPGLWHEALKALNQMVLPADLAGAPRDHGR